MYVIRIIKRKTVEKIKKDAQGFDLESFSFNLWTLVPKPLGY